jgi:hypothetical protein
MYATSVKDVRDAFSVGKIASMIGAEGYPRHLGLQANFEVTSGRRFDSDDTDVLRVGRAIHHIDTHL